MELKKILSVISLLVVLGVYAVWIAICFDLESSSYYTSSFLFILMTSILFILMAVQLYLTEDCLNLAKQYSFYADYHQNKVNKVIHIITIWIIVATTVYFFTYASYHDFAWLGGVFVFCYSLYYILLHPLLGSFACILLIIFFAVSVMLCEEFRYEYSNTSPLVALVINLCAWVLQILGHVLFEKRAPAFLDNMAQSFIMAPLFVLLELNCFGLEVMSKDNNDDVAIVTKYNSLDEAKAINEE